MKGKKIHFNANGGWQQHALIEKLTRNKFTEYKEKPSAYTFNHYINLAAADLKSFPVCYTCPNSVQWNSIQWLNV